jgi:hypothetical protein
MSWKTLSRVIRKRGNEQDTSVKPIGLPLRTRPKRLPFAPRPMGYCGVFYTALKGEPNRLGGRETGSKASSEDG